MAEKRINGRLVQKHDIQSNWERATKFTPMAGEIIIYDIDSTHFYARIKIGDGIHNVNELPFANDALRTEIFEQINNVDTKVNEVSALVGDASVSDQIDEALLNSQADWNQTDNTKPDYIKNKPDENDALELVSEMGLAEPVFAEDGSVYTDENGVLYTL
jgi:hypothetical protein